MLGTDAELQVAEFSRGKPTVRALLAVLVHWVRAGATLALGESCHDQWGRGG